MGKNSSTKGSLIYNKDDLYKILDRIILWIENSDTKASIIIGAIGVVLAVLLSKDYIIICKNIVVSMISNMSIYSIIYIGVFSVSIIFICYGSYCLLKVLVARANIDLYKENRLQANSLIFFSTIANFESYKEYKKSLERSTEVEQGNDLISQIYICSKICDRKLKNYKKGCMLVFWGVIIFIIIIIIGVIVT